MTNEGGLNVTCLCSSLLEPKITWIGRCGPRARQAIGNGHHDETEEDAAVTDGQGTPEPALAPWGHAWPHATDPKIGGRQVIEPGSWSLPGAERLTAEIGGWLTPSPLVATPAKDPPKASLAAT